MAEKKVIVIAADSAPLDGAGDGLADFKKKAVILNKYAPGKVAADVLRIEGAVSAKAEELEEVFGKGAALAVLDCGNLDAAGLDKTLQLALQAADRRTLVVLATDKALCFYGLGIARGAVIEREASFMDVMPTVAYIAGLYLPADCSGAIIYQVLKDPNAPFKELEKMQAALMRMEAALQRDNREPWDKHDCA